MIENEKINRRSRLLSSHILSIILMSCRVNMSCLRSSPSLNIIINSDRFSLLLMTSQSGFFFEFINFHGKSKHLQVKHSCKKLRNTLHFSRTKALSYRRLSMASVKKVIFLRSWFFCSSPRSAFRDASRELSLGHFLISRAIFLISSFTRTSLRSSVRYSPETIRSYSRNIAKRSYEGFRCSWDFKLQNSSCPTTKGFKRDLSNNNS